MSISDHGTTSNKIRRVTEKLRRNCLIPLLRVLLPISVTNVKQLNSGVNQKCPKTAVRSQAADSEFIHLAAEIMLMALPLEG